MYVDALSFLEDEREAWAPFEALVGLADADLARALPEDGPAHGWSGRDLMAHLSGWQQVALDAARDLALRETSATMERVDAESRSAGEDAINERMTAEWRKLPMEEVRRRFTTTPGELRGYLTVVPEARWVKKTSHLEFFLENTLDHYEDHVAELQAVLALARA
ncbi:MAG TPA: hypothetical protein VN800_04410 [Candidatus Acidoferrales bacterium]|nr:hypothetical protein [Candidatus Acidoferrales bacterium]